MPLILGIFPRRRPEPSALAACCSAGVRWWALNRRPGRVERCL